MADRFTREPTADEMSAAIKTLQAAGVERIGEEYMAIIVAGAAMSGPLDWEPMVLVLRAEVERLRRALRPLATIAAIAMDPGAMADNECPVHFAGHCPLTWGDVRRARVVLGDDR